MRPRSREPSCVREVQSCRQTPSRDFAPPYAAPTLSIAYRGRMKYRVPDLVLGCLLTVAIFAVGIVFAASGRFIQSSGEAVGFSWLTKDASGFFTSLQFIVA